MQKKRGEKERKALPRSHFAGQTCLLDLESRQFDTYLKVQDANGKILAENDDMDYPNNMNSRLLFTPTQDGTYRLVATSFGQQNAGASTLTVRQFVQKSE